MLERKRRRPRQSGRIRAEYVCLWQDEDESISWFERMYPNAPSPEMYAFFGGYVVVCIFFPKRPLVYACR